MADFKKIIKNYLDDFSKKDSEFAKKYASEKKSLDECLEYIKGEAKKQMKSGCVVIEDAEVFGWAVHYYDEEEGLKVGTEGAGAVMVATLENASESEENVSGDKVPDEVEKVAEKPKKAAKTAGSESKPKVSKAKEKQKPKKSGMAASWINLLYGKGNETKD